MGEVKRWWVADRYELRQGPTFANIGCPEEAVQVVLASDYAALMQERDALKEEVEELRSLHGIDQ